MINKGDLKNGDIVWVKFNPSIGHEYQKERPAIVIQSNTYLQKLNLVTIIPLTSNLKNNSGDDILIKANNKNNLAVDSLAKLFCITTFDYQRFIKKIGVVDEEIMAKIKKYLKRYFDL